MFDENTNANMLMLLSLVIHIVVYCAQGWLMTYDFIGTMKLCCQTDGRWVEVGWAMKNSENSKYTLNTARDKNWQ
jgi:hypothetical protein